MLNLSQVIELRKILVPSYIDEGDQTYSKEDMVFVIERLFSIIIGMLMRTDFTPEEMIKIKKMIGENEPQEKS